jgi:hypothetical protein
MPSIANSEDFLAFIRNVDCYFTPLMSWTKQKKASKDLLKKYLEVGFCRFRYPSGNGFHRRWTRENLGFAYLPQSLNPRIHARLRPSVRCAQ